MWNIKIFKSVPAQIGLRILWALGALVLFWVHPVLLFPVWAISRKLEHHNWKPLEMGWRAWEKCLIPSAVYVPAHLLLFG